MGTKILSQVWFRFGLLFCGVGLFTAATAPALGREPRAYGERLVAQYRLPADTIARYTALAAGAADDASPREQTLFADAAPWVGPKQRAGVGHNPYTLVLTVSGVTRSAGAVYAQWQAGWEIHDSPVASREVLMLLPGIARAGLAAGEALTLSVSGGRVSFRGERSVAPMLGLVQARNLTIEAVELQVWSGAAPMAWALPQWSRMTPLALGAACLLVGLSLTYRRRGLPAAAVARPASAARRCKPAPVEAAAPIAAPIADATNHVATVVAALDRLLTVGLAVQSVPDDRRPQPRP